eukprot:scaffold7620_cov484-Prasinococcus_capsulatus_cf.AAC.3
MATQRGDGDTWRLVRTLPELTGAATQRFIGAPQLLGIFEPARRGPCRKREEQGARLTCRIFPELRAKMPPGALRRSRSGATRTFLARPSPSQPRDRSSGWLSSTGRGCWISRGRHAAQGSTWRREIHPAIACSSSGRVPLPSAGLAPRVR